MRETKLDFPTQFTLWLVWYFDEASSSGSVC